MIGMTLAFALAAFASQPAGQACLHGPDSSPQQKQRRSEAVGAARYVNSVQANQPRSRQREYLTHEQLAALPPRASGPALDLTPGNEILAGWQLTISTTQGGYWFMIKDTTDPCHFALISNQDGIVYTAQPIR
jgi:hypothetical protein